MTASSVTNQLHPRERGQKFEADKCIVCDKPVAGSVGHNYAYHPYHTQDEVRQGKDKVREGQQAKLDQQRKDEAQGTLVGVSKTGRGLKEPAAGPAQRVETSHPTPTEIKAAKTPEGNATLGQGQGQGEVKSPIQSTATLKPVGAQPLADKNIKAPATPPTATGNDSLKSGDAVKLDKTTAEPSQNPSPSPSPDFTEKKPA